MKQLFYTLVAAFALSALLAFVGFPLLRSTQVWSEATVFTSEPCKAFGETRGEMCAYTGEVSESFSGARHIRQDEEIVTLASDDVAGMSRRSDAKNLMKWKTDLYAGIIMVFIVLMGFVGIYSSLRGFLYELFGGSKKSRSVA